MGAKWTLSPLRTDTDYSSFRSQDSSSARCSELPLHSLLSHSRNEGSGVFPGKEKKDMKREMRVM
jgi:hypothetical protein